ncbi:MAG: hypothetical protein WC389_16440 [Lutibacter sp.]|jgi:uncharacterized membrane protein
MKTFNDKLKWSYGVKTNRVRTIFRFLLGLNLLFAGISHLTISRLEFVAQVPNWVPLPDDLVVILSGIVEITIGLALLILPKWKGLIGCIVAVFFVLIFPGNIAQYVNQIDAFGLNTDQARFIRLFFQPVLVLWALWSTGSFKAYMKYKRKK